MHVLGASPRRPPAGRRQRRPGYAHVAAGLAALLVATAATLLLLSRTLGVFCPTSQSSASGSGTLGQQFEEAAGGGIVTRRRQRPAGPVAGASGLPAAAGALRAANSSLLLVGHELTYTGAPLALVEIATHLRGRGHRVE